MVKKHQRGNKKRKSESRGPFGACQHKFTWNSVFLNEPFQPEPRSWGCAELPPRFISFHPQGSTQSFYYEMRPSPGRILKYREIKQLAQGHAGTEAWEQAATQRLTSGSVQYWPSTRSLPSEWAQNGVSDPQKHARAQAHLNDSPTGLDEGREMRQDREGADLAFI